MSHKIVSVAVERIERPFARPFRNAKVRMETLSYLRIAVTTGDATGHGEMTAMPGYSPETIAVDDGSHPGALRAGDPRPRPFDGAVEDALQQALPANAYARSGIELALWDLRGRLLGAPVHALIGGAVRKSIPIGAIVTLNSPEAMAEGAARWQRAGRPHVPGEDRRRCAVERGACTCRPRRSRRWIDPGRRRQRFLHRRGSDADDGRHRAARRRVLRAARGQLGHRRTRRAGAARPSCRSSPTNVW